MIGVVTGWTVNHLAVLAQRKIVRNRDRLVVSDKKTMLGLRRRRPRAHPRAGAGTGQVDRRIATELMVVAAARHRFFMRAPAQLGRLQALRNETLDRPGIDELAAWLWRIGPLRVAFRDVNAFDADALHQAAPFLPCPRFDEVEF